MLAVLVMLGAAACTENLDSVDVKGGEGLSFYANFAGGETRTDLQYDENAQLWKSVWEGNETLSVRGTDFITYEFTNSVEEPNKFTCKTEGVESLVGGAVVITLSDRDQSKVGKRGVSVYHTISSFDPKSHIELEADNAFLRYKYEGEGSVTLTITSDADPNQKLFYYDGENQSSVTFEGADQDKWISVCPSGDGNVVNLSYSIDGVECAETRFDIVRGMIYNLGTLAKPTEPEYDSHIYLIPSEEWLADGAWFAAYFFNSESGFNQPVTMTETDGIYECGVPADVDKVIFCRMNPDFTEFGWNTGEEGENDPKHVWNQTADLEIGVEPNNYYHIIGWDKGAWGTKDHYELPVVPTSDYKVYVYKSNNSWGAVNLYMWDENGSPMAGWPGVANSNTTNINGYDYLVWDITKNMEGSDVSVILNDGAGQQTADFALGTFNKDYYLKLDGTNISIIADPSNPEAGSGADPVDPTPASNIGVVGSFQGWDVAAPVAMESLTDGWIVARSVELYKSDEFKFVVGNTWDVSYGNSTTKLYAEPNTEYPLTSDGGQNISVTNNGKFDLYFNIDSKMFKYECVEDYANITVDITINNKANWSPLYIYLECDGEPLTPAEGALVENNVYTISGSYIGTSLTCKFISGSKVSEVQTISIAKTGTIVTLEETVIKLYFQLDTDNSKQWWGSTSKIHVWNTNTSFDTSWPGTTMTKEGDYLWSVIVPSELVGKTINYLIHNGNGWQSKDSKITIQSSDMTVTGSSIGVN